MATSLNNKQLCL